MDTKTFRPVNIYIYENKNESLRLEPISLTRPSFDIRCGIFTFLERIQKLMPAAGISIFVREELKNVTVERFPELEVNPTTVEAGLWLNGLVLWDEKSLAAVMKSSNHHFYANERLIASNLDETLSKRWIAIGGPVDIVADFNLPEIKLSVESPEYLWDCVNLNENAIEWDSSFFNVGSFAGIVDDGVNILQGNNIFVGKNSRVKAGAILDAEKGPIIIGNNVTILPGVYLQGPLFIGDGSLIKAGARIYKGSTIGPGCKVGGEVEESIFQSWSNKQHDGFIGHAYIGEWVNLGANTNNSDLKNNYSNVAVSVNGDTINSGLRSVGLFIGDHSKSGIGTMFNTGTTVGPACNVVGYGFPPKMIKPFSWVINEEIKRHLFDKFVQTSKVVKKRRNQEFSLNEENLYRHIYNQL